ncbi:hypothetical protein BJ508DRAFT_330235 [Ascobolus immersus RN42]|uniref:Extracellular membrane protein CFEM domain-containing protein n=1 Tax=Ascobolus immersus RN42 TaxID=1160509 RepID=A0A3N4HU85_ASCIM|nr:hypothetical protein BJ508DRAFT_330235 [Ascobolus immersus RN42]
MRFFRLIAVASTIFSVSSHSIPNPEKTTLDERSTTKEGNISKPKPPTNPAQSTKHRPLLPTYPKTITNPVDQRSWLMQLARSPEINPYWNFTETLWALCQRHRQPLPKKCVPSCEDVHSHTHLGLHTGVCGENAQICTFATFVLPDSMCPGRVNSFKLRCPKSQEEFNKILYDRSGGYRNDALSNLVVRIKSNRPPKYGGILPPPQCESPPPPKNSTKTPRDLPKEPKKLPTSTPSTSSLHSLRKRDYKYNQYITSKHLYRYFSIEGPRYDLPKVPFRPNRPYECYNSERMARAERVILPGKTDLTSYEMCWYPVGTMDMPEERCPGMKTPDACPKSDEEMVEAIWTHNAYAFKRPGAMTKENLRRILKGIKGPPAMPPCNTESKKSCIAPNEGKKNSTNSGSKEN